MLTIEPALKSEKWPLIKSDGVSVIKNPPSMPLTSLQKSWLKAVSLDPRIKLFDVSFDLPEDISPLFTPDDYYIFDPLHGYNIEYKINLEKDVVKNILNDIRNKKVINLLNNKIAIPAPNAIGIRNFMFCKKVFLKL